MEIFAQMFLTYQIKLFTWKFDIYICIFIYLYFLKKILGVYIKFDFVSVSEQI